MRARWTKAKVRLLITAAVALVVTVGFVIASLALPFDPNATDLSHAYCAPGQDGFLLGSDSVGRDVALRTLFGGSESVMMAFVIVLLAFAVGTVLGLIAGVAGGVVDAVIDKVITMFQAFPSFVLAIAISAILGQGIVNMVFAVVAVKWTEFARLSRSLAIGLKSSDSVSAARVCGAGVVAIACKYVLPNMLSPLAIMAALSIGDVVLTMAGLSFLGLGPGRPTNEWGAMMSEAASCFQFAPWCILVPGVALFIVVTVFNLLGDALRDAMDGRDGQVVPEGDGREIRGFLLGNRKGRVSNESR